MAFLFGPEGRWFWTAVLAVALFFPVRQLIWVVSVRRQERKQRRQMDDAERVALKRRAGFTATLLCFIFSLFYVQAMISKLYLLP
ncbi:MAG TPA: hypothetical protein DEP36_02575 [Gammaproteobacteria bacterium]|nr:hypothetical protein [Gammaproteobacteria bacterium]